jgi:hypothetical protein
MLNKVKSNAMLKVTQMQLSYFHIETITHSLIIVNILYFQSLPFKLPSLIIQKQHV